MKPLYYDTHFMEAVRLIRNAEALTRKMNCILYLGFSGGKDSQTLYHLAKSIGCNFVAHHLLTTVEPPELIKFIRSNYPDVVTIRQRLSMGALIRKRKTLPTRFARYCCAYYKELKYPNSVVLTGIRKAESFSRAKRTELEIGARKAKRRVSFSLEYFPDDDQLTESMVKCVHGKDQIIVNPLINWTNDDVEYYLKEVVNVPRCSLYDEGFKRMGCILCPLKGWKDKMLDLQRYPKYSQMYIRAIHRLRQESNFMSDHPNLTDEQIFDWWTRDVSFAKWLADNVQQLSLF